MMFFTCRLIDCHPLSIDGYSSSNSIKNQGSYIHPSQSIKMPSISTQIICEGDHLNVTCMNSNQILVYKAWFGFMGQSRTRIQHGLRPFSCRVVMSSLRHSDPSDPNSLPSCPVIHVTSAVKRHCHGKSECGILANKQILISDESVVSSPACPINDYIDSFPSHHKNQNFSQLAVQYSCVTREVFEKHESGVHEDFHPPAANTRLVHFANFVSSLGLQPTKTMTKTLKETNSSQETVITTTEGHTTSPEDDTPRDPTLNPSAFTPRAEETVGDDFQEKKKTTTSRTVRNSISNCTSSHDSSRPLSIGFSGDWISAYVFFYSEWFSLLIPNVYCKSVLSHSRYFISWFQSLLLFSTFFVNYSGKDILRPLLKLHSFMPESCHVS